MAHSVSESLPGLQTQVQTLKVDGLLLRLPKNINNEIDWILPNCGRSLANICVATSSRARMDPLGITSIHGIPCYKLYELRIAGKKNGGKLSKEMADMAETFLFWSVLTTGSGHSGGFSTWQYKPFRNQTWPRETRLCYTSLPLERCKFPWIPRTSWHKLEIGAKHQEGSISGTPRGGWLPKPQATLAVSAQSRVRNQTWYSGEINEVLPYIPLETAGKTVSGMT